MGHPAAIEKAHVNDILHQLGFDHEKLTYTYNGLRFRHTRRGQTT